MAYYDPETLIILTGGLRRQMNETVLFSLGLDRHIQNRVDLVCEHEEAAQKRCAKQLVDGHDVESIPPSEDYPHSLATNQPVAVGAFGWVVKRIGEATGPRRSSKL